MKILIITPWYPNRIHTQDGNFVRHQVALLAQDHTVEVCAVIEDPRGEIGAGPQVQQQVEKGNVLVTRVYYNGRGSRPQRLWRRRQAWRAALQRRKMAPDLLHAHVLIDGGIVASRLAGRLRVPFVVTEHSHRYLEPWPRLRIPELWLARQAARRAAAIIPVSPSLQRGMDKHGIPGNYHIIPNVVQTALFYPTEKVAADTFTFVHVSDFSPNKNVTLLLRAFAQIAPKYPKASLHLAGNGDHAALEQLSQTLHLRPRQLTISGPHEPAAIAGIMRRADAFVLCSTVETQSLVLIEALLSGIPCISSRCGGPEDIIDHPNKGILVPTQNLTALVDAMQQLLANGPSPPAQRRRVSDQARQDFGTTRQQLNTLYRAICPPTTTTS